MLRNEIGLYYHLSLFLSKLLTSDPDEMERRGKKFAEEMAKGQQ